MSRRFQGETTAEKLTQNTVYDEDQIQIRTQIGTDNDSDKGVSKSILQSSPVAVCTSGAGTAAKSASISNFPDFTLTNGREVVVYFSNGNTASNPTLNVNNTGSIPLEGAYWNAGSFVKCKYVDITVSGNRIQKWLCDIGAYNSLQQLNVALTELNFLNSLNKNRATNIDSYDSKYVGKFTYQYVKGAEVTGTLPAENADGTLITMHYDNALFKTQMFITMSNIKVFVRSMNSGNWGNWVEL